MREISTSISPVADPESFLRECGTIRTGAEYENIDL
jgi:hypothetical protein